MATTIVAYNELAGTGQGVGGASGDTLTPLGVAVCRLFLSNSGISH